MARTYATTGVAPPLWWTKSSRAPSQVISAVKRATATIPVVMAVSRDPVGAKFIASLARPGANTTGLANDTAPEIIGKNLALLKEAVPRVSRVAYLWNPVPPGADTSKNVVESAARNLGVGFQSVEVPGGTLDHILGGVGTR